MTKVSKAASIVFASCFLLFSFVLYPCLISQEECLQNRENSAKTDVSDKRSTYKIEDLMGDEEKIIESKVSPDGSFALVQVDQETQTRSFGEDGEGAELVMWEKLVMVDLEAGEKKSLDSYAFASDEMVAFLEDAPMSQYTLYLDAVSWSEDGKAFWGVASMVPGADPPFASHFSVFRIDAENLSVERYPLPDGTISCNLNVPAGKVLAEAMNEDNLRLFVKDIYTQKEEELAVYDNVSYEKHEYIYPDFFEVEVQRMEPAWTNENSVRYIDFATRQEVTKEIK